MNRFSTIINLFFRFPQKYYGFINGHYYLSPSDIQHLKGLVEREDISIVQQFENSFSKLIGPGKSVCFATGRMGFYALLKVLNIGEGDEVIILGHTCSVMPNAVFRSGAKPVYSDLDLETLGSCAKEIKKVITNKTKLVVAQHSFGIPCKINEIARLCKEEKIFLLEDCALTLDSRIDKEGVGNFGDAALFSTDHSKPINTITGGLVYTKNNNLSKLLRKVQIESKSLSLEVKLKIWNKLLEEAKFCNPRNYRKIQLFKAVRSFFLGYLDKKSEYLNEDFGRSPSKSYPYPAKLPTFLSALGLKELERWNAVKARRIELLKKYLDLMESLNLTQMVPKAYYSQNIDIIPLRFVILYPKAIRLRKNLASYIPTNWFWFTQPIQECESGDPRDLGYSVGSCKNSERVNELVINFPCFFDVSSDEIFFDKTSYYIEDSI